MDSNSLSVVDYLGQNNMKVPTSSSSKAEKE
jgi:hypothetical protein